MTIIKIVRPPKIIDYELQHKHTLTLVKVINKVIGSLLDPKDIISYANTKVILEVCPPLFSFLSGFMSKQTVVHLVQALINLSMCIVQYGFLSWFQYLLLTPSGLRMAFKLIFENPTYGVLWYLSLYFSAIRATADEVVFNKFADLIGLPHHSLFDFGLDYYKKLSSSITIGFQSYTDFNIAAYLGSVEAASGIMTTVLSEVTMQITNPLADKINKKLKGDSNEIHILPGETSKKVPLDSIPVKKMSSSGNITKDTAEWFGSILNKVFKKEEKLLHLPVYIPERDAIHHNDEEMMEHLLSIRDTKEMKKLVKMMMVGKKNDKRAKLRAKKLLSEVHNSSGQKLCIGKCETRVKTLSGNYCSSDCSKTPAFGSREWCWIEPASKGANTRDTYLGKPYDYCDSQKLSKKKLCFTGVSYEECQ